MSIFTPPARAALLAAGAALALLAASGCSNDQPQTPAVVTPAPAPVVTTATTPGPAVTTVTPGGPPATKVNVNAGPGGSTGVDSATANAVNKAIVTNKQMTGSRIEVVVDASGVATLTGTVQDQQQKALAATTASNTPGVSGVKNKIEIVATGGAKSASKPPVTKVIVIHQTPPAPKSSSPAPPSAPAPPAAPASPDNGGKSDGTTDTNAGTTDNTGGATDTTTPATGKTP